MFIALYNRNMPDADGVVQSVAAKLAECGIDSVVVGDSLPSTHIDFIFSFGGDGTLLSAVHLIGNRGIPVVGLNFGHLGFLTTAGRDDVAGLIDALRMGSYTVEHRTLLGVAAPGVNDYALNDAVLHRALDEPLMKASLYLDGKFVAQYSADGLIVATPTGSTAYSLSCGGPILAPDCGCFVITPIAAHSLTLRPIIVSDSSAISIVLHPLRGAVSLSLDSRSLLLDSGCQIHISRSPFSISLVRLAGHDFFSAIRSKLGFD